MAVVVLFGRGAALILALVAGDALLCSKKKGLLRFGLTDFK